MSNLKGNLKGNLKSKRQELALKSRIYNKSSTSSCVDIDTGSTY